MIYGMGQTKFKDDLEELIKEKLKDLSDMPVYITPDLKRRITTLIDDFLDLRQRKKFTRERGIEMMDEIDAINIELSKLARKRVEPTEESRKRKTTKPKSKRKIVKKR